MGSDGIMWYIIYREHRKNHFFHPKASKGIQRHTYYTAAFRERVQESLGCIACMHELRVYITRSMYAVVQAEIAFEESMESFKVFTSSK